MRKLTTVAFCMLWAMPSFAAMVGGTPAPAPAQKPLDLAGGQIPKTDDAPKAPATPAKPAPVNPDAEVDPNDLSLIAGAEDPAIRKMQRDMAFQQLLDSSLPLAPQQIIQLRKMLDMTQQAVATSPKNPPLPLSSTMSVKLEPGAPSPVIRLSSGFVSSVVFLDATGAPWPIEAYGVGDPNTFNIQWDLKSNTLFIQAMKNYSHGNLAVRLVGENTPVMISLISGQKEIDYRVDLQILGRGPNAMAPILPDTVQGSKIAPALIHLLDGVPPEGSQKLEMDANFGQAWYFKKKLYVRTRLQLLSPAWVATISSADGTRVYELMPTPQLLATKDGHTVHIYLKGF